MIQAILDAMRRPMAAPPGQRSAVGRAAPEICAALVYLVAAVVTFAAWDEKNPALIGALAGYAVACLLMVIGPVSSAAQSLVFEYEGRTAEALVLTPGDHAGLALGRYWHATLPWLRFMAWLLPIYASHAVNGMTDARESGEFLALSGLFAVAPRLFFIAGLAAGIGSDGMHPCWTAGLTAARFCVDAIAVLLAAAIAFQISARMRRSWAAAAVSYALVIGSFLSVFLAVEWAAVLIGVALSLAAALTGWAPGSGLGLEPELLIGLCLLAKVGMVAFEAWTAHWLVAGVARNFDFLLLGESSGRLRSRVTVVPRGGPGVRR